MESRDLDRIRHVSNTEVIRRLLIRYFIDKGYDNSFDRLVYPPDIQDMPLVIPILATKVEIIPNAVEIDTSLGRAVLEWNLFLLGVHRMYLGDTYHNSLRDLAKEIKNGMVTKVEVQRGQSTRNTTPRKIIAFITRVLSSHESGYINLAPAQAAKEPGAAYAAKQTLNAVPGQMFARTPT